MVQWKRIILSTNGAGPIAHSQAKKQGLTQTLHLSQKLTQLIINLNIKHRTRKLLEDEIGEKVADLGFGDDVFRHNTKNTIRERKN